MPLFMLAIYLQKDAKPPDEFYCGDEVLRVRAYGALYITLGINIRLLFSPKKSQLFCMIFFSSMVEFHGKVGQ